MAAKVLILQCKSTVIALQYLCYCHAKAWILHAESSVLDSGNSNFCHFFSILSHEQLIFIKFFPQ